MPNALPIDVRQQIIEQFSKGFSLLAIAQSLNLSYTTVRRVYKRYNTLGVKGLKPHYEHCGRPAAYLGTLLERAALYLKRHHPSWGAALIGLILQQRYSPLVPPGERTLQRWFKAHRLGRPKDALCLPPQPTCWAQQVHDVWQIDAKEKLVLTSTQRACYLSVVDEKSGCLLSAQVFPPLPYQ